jgi:hypothetical protein
MPVVYYQARLKVQPTTSGNAELAVPKALRNLNYHFVLVKDGGEEGIVAVDEPKAALDTIGEDKALTRLTPKQADTLRQSYPPPRLKQRFRQDTAASDEPAPAEQFALDDKGKRIVDTVQTVRSGFYLIDVPVVPD